jgi:DNA-binding transcriptional MerR regulator
MIRYLTSGQVAKKLRISVSTLKRWLDEAGLDISDQRNYNGWRLFSEDDLKVLMEYKRNLKRNGKRFNETTLLPVVLSGTKSVQNG